MRGNTISIELPLKRGKVSKTIPLYQYDYGQKLIITGAELPEYYEVHFSNEMHGDAVTSIGDSTGVLIPDALLATGENVYLWLYLHADSDDGETEFQGAIPVIKRAQVTDQTPTPAEQSVITQAIAALTAASAEATEAKEDAEAAQQHIENMGVAATTLPTGSDATVTKTVDASGEVTLTFGLPRGVKGDRGDRGLQGETGNAGEDGEDGFSPVVSLTKSGKVTTFSVTDAEDTYSVEINDGEDGNPGQDATPDLITVDYSDLTFPVAAGTMCYHSGMLYKANQAIATSEEWTAAHWTQTTIEEEYLSLKTQINSKYEKPTGGIPSTDMTSAVQASLAKADTALQGESVASAVDDWLDENITNPDSPPLDRSLSSSSAAVPADIAGNIVSKMEKVEVVGTSNKWDKDKANTGLLHKNGNVYTGASYDMYVYGVSIPVEEGDAIRVFFKVNGAFALGTFTRVASYDSSGTIVPDSGSNETQLYTVPSGIASIRVTIMGDYNSTAMVIFNDDTVPSEYIPYQEGYCYYLAGDDFVPNLGNLDGLKTTEKSSAVGAINEVKEQADTLDDVLDVETLKSKNLNTAKYQSNTDGGVTFTLNDDGSISLSGTATRDAFFYDGTNQNNRFELPAGEYTLSGGYSSKVSIYINFYADQTTTTPAISAVYSGASANSFTTASKYYCSINVYIVNGENTNGITLYPQLEEGGEATDYVPPAEWDESLRLQDIEEDIEELQNEVMGSDLNVPSYYNTDSYLANKCKRFNTLARQSSGTSDSFAFVTDLHWTQNAGKSPSLLRFIKKNTRIDKLFCGGDICDFEEIESRPYDAFSNFVKAWDNQIYTAVGNHEYISQYGTEGRAYYSFNSLGKDRIGNLDRSYFYFDNPQAKIRYIFLSAYKANSGTPASGYEQAQLTWLENVALNLESGWGAIVVTHMTHSVYENASIGQTATDMLNVLDAYDGEGEIICVISGHTHADYYDTTTGGIPIIVTTCDKYMPWISGSTNMEPWLSDRVAGTITEQAIDLFLIDRTAETITKVRVGCPIHYGTDLETWTEYEDVTISYSRE